MPCFFFRDSTNTVREIFEKFFEGYGLSTIGKDFNRCGIKSPEFFLHRKKNPRHTEVARKFLWVQTSVKHINEWK